MRNSQIYAFNTFNYLLFRFNFSHIQNVNYKMNRWNLIRMKDCNVSMIGMPLPMFIIYALTEENSNFAVNI